MAIPNSFSLQQQNYVNDDCLLVLSSILQYRQWKTKSFITCLSMLVSRPFNHDQTLRRREHLGEIDNTNSKNLSLGSKPQDEISYDADKNVGLLDRWFWADYRFA